MNPSRTLTARFKRSTTRRFWSWGAGVMILLMMATLWAMTHSAVSRRRARNRIPSESHQEESHPCPPASSRSQYRLVHKPQFDEPSVCRELIGHERWSEPHSVVAADQFELPRTTEDDSIVALPTIGNQLQQSQGWIRLSLGMYRRKLARKEFEWFSVALRRQDVDDNDAASCKYCVSHRSGGGGEGDVASGVRVVESLNHVMHWTVLRTSSPRLLYLDSVIDDSFCDDLIRLGNATLQRSTVMFDKGGDKGDTTTDGRNVENSVRTSSGSFLTSYADRTAPANVALRVAVAYMLGVPETFLEPTQILRYEAGQYYVPHLDYYRLDETKELQHGQRVATALIWLSDVTCGGETAFPAADIHLAPHKGDGVVFYNVGPDAGLPPDPTSLHEGEPPRGASTTKWVAVLWAHPRAITHST